MIYADAARLVISAKIGNTRAVTSLGLVRRFSKTDEVKPYIALFLDSNQDRPDSSLVELTGDSIDFTCA